MHWMDCALTGDVAYYLTSSDTGQDDDGFNCVFPVVCRRGLVGMIDIGFSGQQDGIEPDEAGLVHGVLRILRNHLSTLDYADRDTLTGLLNRRTFESNFAKRQSDTLSLTPNKVWISNNWLLMVDVDRFKRINDEFGHLFGDEVLLLVARILNQSFRGVAAVYRFGGEEFVVILEAETMEIAQRAADRFRLAMQNHRFPQVAQVTVSLGYTRLQALDVPASAVQRADAALYFAKSNGRNQCQCYEQLVSDGLLEVRPPRPAEVEFF
jgi:diguanylate cyclase (GGDEF)-like protein